MTEYDVEIIENRRRFDNRVTHVIFHNGDEVALEDVFEHVDRCRDLEREAIRAGNGIPRNLVGAQMATSVRLADGGTTFAKSWYDSKSLAVLTIGIGAYGDTRVAWRELARAGVGGGETEMASSRLKALAIAVRR